MRAVIPIMLKQTARDGGCRGTLITIASNAAHHGAPEKAVSWRILSEVMPFLMPFEPYCASKGALVSMNRALAVVGRRGQETMAAQAERLHRTTDVKASNASLSVPASSRHL